jgi:hypothetical protein
MSEGVSQSGPMAARIGGSAGYYIFGIIALIFGFGFSLGGLSMMGTASFFTTIGAVLIAVGFWVSLFGKIEQRLIDVERAILSFRAGPPQ